MQESRQHIKTRMLKNAARAWGYPETESESNFDPLVSMLLSACSIELEKISGEIQASRARVLERMVQLLSPDAFTGALPAHAVATATPIETKTELAENAQFYITRKVQSASDETDTSFWKDIYFTPTASFQLNKSTIKFMATGNKLYRMSNAISKDLNKDITKDLIKEPVGQTETGKELPANTLWLGIDEPEVSLQNTLFYFDIRNEANKQQFYHQLPKASWYWDDRTIPHLPGYGERPISGERPDLKNILQREDDISGKIKRQVNAFYKSYFVTLTDPQDITTSEGNAILFDMINEAFTGKPAELIKQHSLRWVCIDFPQTITSVMLEDVICVMNCFPVFNRRAVDITYRMQEVVNVIPLQTEDLFLDLEEVSNEDGKILTNRTFQKKEEEAISILLRNGGVGRFDERDAVSVVDYLIQLLRDESAAFSAIGNDFMNSEMKQLQQVINKLEQRIYSTQMMREQTPYLIVRNNMKSPWNNIFIRYWSTSGTDANNIKAGNTLRQYKGSNIENSQIILLSTSIGGHNKLSNTESVLAFKTALLSKDRLISSEDIKAFCHYKLGERVNKIDIEKGVMIHPDQQKGFMKTIDVMIDINRKDYEDMLENGEVTFWIENLKLLLEEKSVALLPYRIFIKQAA